MNYRTDLMRAILTSEKAQEIIDYVSPIYGESYVGLWLLQSIGSVLGEAYGISEQLRYETNPASALLLLDYWEDHYDLPRDTSLTTEQRRARLLAKIRSKGPCNPEKLAAAVSSVLGGAEVVVTENAAKNTFLVSVREMVDSLAPAEVVLDRKKPAHLIYWLLLELFMESEAKLTVATAVSHGERHPAEIEALLYETASVDLRPAAAVTLAEEYTTEVVQ